MYKITLTAAQRDDLRASTRQRDLAPSTRDRLEMVRLSDAGWSVPRIARSLGQHEHTVRAWIKAFLEGALPPCPTNRGAVNTQHSRRLSWRRSAAARGHRAAHLDGGAGGGLGG